MKDHSKMTSVVQLADCVGQTVEGVYLVHPGAESTACNGIDFVRVRLEDATGIMTGTAFQGSYTGPTLAEPMMLHTTLLVRQLSHAVVANVLNATQLPLDAVPTPTRRPTRAELMRRLEAVRRKISKPALRDFVADALNNADIGPRFCAAAGSRQHHHAYEHGLLHHSVEVAEEIARMPASMLTLRDIAIVGGLFHDVGKIWTLDAAAKVNGARDLDHGQLTLEILAPHLRQLDIDDIELANQLRFIWTRHYAPPRQETVAATAAAIVALADRMDVKLGRN